MLADWDVHLARRTLAVALVAAAIAAAIVVATDEPGSTAALRGARLAALTPALAALAVGWARALSAERGELRALGALGMRPERQLVGAVVAAWGVGLAATAALLTPWVDPTSLFPTLPVDAAWVPSGAVLPAGAASAPSADGLEPPGGGARFLAEGGIEWVAARAGVGARATPGGVAAALLVGPLALLAPPWAATAPGRGELGVVLGSALALAVGALHGVAAGRVPVGVLPLASAPLAVALLVRVATAEMPPAPRATP